MKRRLRHLYWTGIVITMVMATVAVAMMVKLKIDDSREALRSILHAASAWTMESTEDLQSMAESIASVSPPLRVTFLMEQGLVLADGLHCLPAKLTPLSDGRSIVCVQEGKYHQVRRMLASRGCPVTYLRREAEGGLTLGSLPLGQTKELDIVEAEGLLQNIL